MNLVSRIRDLPRRAIGNSFWSVADQGLFAVSNFVLNLILARWLSVADYGAFSLAFTLFLLLGTVHTALVVEPLLVFGAGRYNANVGAYLRSVLNLHWVLAALLSLVLGALVFLWPSLRVQLGGTTLALMFTAPLILFQWLARRACYIDLQPALAARAGGVYPAYRWQTQLLRSLLRLRATCLPSTATSRQAWLLAEWPPHILADLRPAALLVGTAGPAQKLTLRLVDASGRVAAFLKWSDKPAGIARLQCERRVLEALPRGLGPAVLHFGEAGGGVGLLVEALSGRPGVPSAQVPPDALAFLEVLQRSATGTAGEHPWLARWLEQPAVASWAAKLTRRAWPVVPQLSRGQKWRESRETRVQPHGWAWSARREGHPGHV